MERKRFRVLPSNRRGKFRPPMVATATATIPFNLLSMAFDGTHFVSSSYNSDIFASTDKFSVSAWVKTAGTAWQGSQYIVSRWLPNTQNVWRWFNRDATRTAFYVASAVSDSGANFGQFLYPTAQAWHHFVWVYDGTGVTNGDRLKVYVDGVSGSLTFGGTIPATTTAGTSGFEISRKHTAAAFSGSIDNVSYYSGTLSLAQAQAIYNSGVPVNEETLPTSGSLKLYFRMGEGVTTPFITIPNEVSGNVGTVYDTTGSAGSWFTSDVPA